MRKLNHGDVAALERDIKRDDQRVWAYCKLRNFEFLLWRLRREEGPEHRPLYMHNPVRLRELKQAMQEMVEDLTLLERMDTEAERRGVV